MDYRTELVNMIERFNIQSLEEFKEAELLLMKDSRFSRITKKKDYDGHIRQLKQVKNNAKKINPKAVKIPESDTDTLALRQAFEKCLVSFSAVCDNYVRIQLALKAKSEGENITYSQYKELNDRLKKSRNRLNEEMHEMDILYTNYTDYFEGDNSEDLAGVEYKTYDQL